MALRFRRDVQKASYYVWFLGAEEAKGLRGGRVISSALPYLIDRSIIQEPLKVTLQVSHKGIKIIQGHSKHFIPHSAITYAVQIGDIVACILLLYNPETKCPLHVHAYRCDSETTAEALHQQLEVLINRPENQKQYEELERRIGLNTHDVLQSTKIKSSPKKVESSLESTSTRDSECSGGSFCAPLSSSPNIKEKRNIFDSLAAELRAKLNGSGPPLLLPPRDYDTVHRSKGNIFKNKFKINESSSDEDLSLRDTANSNRLVKANNNIKFRKDLPTRLKQNPINANKNLYLDFNKQRDNKISANIVRPSSFDNKLENLDYQKKNEIEKYYSMLHENYSYQHQDPSYLEHMKEKKHIKPNYVPENVFNRKNYKTNPIDKQFDIRERINLTDKQKYLQMCEKDKIHHKNVIREHPLNLPKYRSSISIEKDFYQQNLKDTLYKQTENTNYKYGIEPLNSNRPLLRRNSFDNDNTFNIREYSYINNSNLDSEMSASDRFHGAKEKFRLIERSISADINNRYNNKKYLGQSPVFKFNN